jgi:diadenosine tetraphosphatase ApaH/serine/threonine PP2A family protein phosphatase
VRLAVLSDVHANLEALRAVLDHAGAQAPDALVCLGDFVGYGPDPNACVDVLAGRVRAAVVGNHDLAALGARPIADFNLWAQEAIVWTQRMLTASTRAYLAALPDRAHLADLADLLFVHGSPRAPADEYILDVRTARASFAAAGFRIAMVGHTHQPAVFTWARHRVGAVGLLPEVPLRLEPEHRYIINVGSVGQPRDGDPRAAYVLLDTGRREATLFRVAYPIAEVQRKMEAAGLPTPLIERLALGL